jgi:DNA repair exonuclease SbcCD nuclease subunit
LSSVYERYEDESVKQYILRLCRNKDLYRISWQDVAHLINDETGESWGESKYRKWFYAFQEGYEEALSENPFDFAEEFEEQKRELIKEKTKMQDQRREYMNLIKKQARFENLRDEIMQAIKEETSTKPLEWKRPKRSFQEGREGLALFSDWHYGMICDNKFNQFNEEVFFLRVGELVEKVIEYGKRNEIETLNLAVLGDMISGMIHVSTRVQSNEDVIQQIKVVAETLCEVISQFASEFSKVRVINVCGNHARAGKKDEVGLKENFEYLLPWYMEARLDRISNVEIITEDDGMVQDEILGKSFVFTHGNFDHFSSSAKSLPQTLGYVPDYIIGGHIHHNFEKDFGHTTYIANGSLIGADDYAVQKRLITKPMQKFLVMTEDGCECTYNIYL